MKEDLIFNLLARVRELEELTKSQEKTIVKIVQMLDNSVQLDKILFERIKQLQDAM